MQQPYIISLDLEFNQPSQRIVQIGAVVGHIPSGKVHGRFSCFVAPEEPLAPEISDLCGITPSALDLAGTLPEAFEQLMHWMHPYRDELQRNPLTWGGADSDTLRRAVGLDERSYVFGRRWLDVKTVYAAWRHARGQSPQGGLKSSMKQLGLVFQGRPHDAADDALNTFRAYHCLLQHWQPAGSGKLPGSWVAVPR